MITVLKRSAILVVYQLRRRSSIPLEKSNIWGVVRYGLDNKITVYRYHDNNSQRAYDSADDALAYRIGEDCLRDIITQVAVIFRSI